MALIFVLATIALPVIRNTRESATRVKCASNLRQLGQIELRYAAENRGWLLLRHNTHPVSVSQFSAPGSGCFSVPLSRLAPPNAWFCPNATDRFTGRPLTDSDRSLRVNKHEVGYGFFGAVWEAPTKTVVFGSNPAMGAVGVRVSHKVGRLTQLKPDKVRAAEWWEPPPGLGGTGGGLAALVPPHADRNGNMAGGNYLTGDGAVHWTPTVFPYYGFDLYLYALPADKPNSN